jgi:hypothetical protein
MQFILKIMASLIKKIFDKKDYVRFILIPSSPEKGTEKLNEFTREVNLNKGRVKSIQIVNHQETAWEYYTQDIPGERYAEDKYDSYTKHSHFFYGSL